MTRDARLLPSRSVSRTTGAKTGKHAGAIGASRENPSPVGRDHDGFDGGRAGARHDAPGRLGRSIDPAQPWTSRPAARGLRRRRLLRNDTAVRFVGCLLPDQIGIDLKQMGFGSDKLEPPFEIAALHSWLSPRFLPASRRFDPRSWPQRG